MSDLLIVIPAYNEEKNIERVVDRLIRDFPQYDYLVINDGSKDRTGEICRERGYEFHGSAGKPGTCRGISGGAKICGEKGVPIRGAAGRGRPASRPEYWRP